MEQGTFSPTACSDPTVRRVVTSTRNPRGLVRGTKSSGSLRLTPTPGRGLSRGRGTGRAARRLQGGLSPGGGTDRDSREPGWVLSRDGPQAGGVQVAGGLGSRVRPARPRGTCRRHGGGFPRPPAGRACAREPLGRRAPRFVNEAELVARTRRGKWVAGTRSQHHLWVLCPQPTSSGWPLATEGSGHCRALPSPRAGRDQGPRRFGASGEGGGPQHGARRGHPCGPGAEGRACACV